MGNISMNRGQLGAMAMASAFFTVLSCSDRSASDIAGITLDDSKANEALIASASVTLAQSSIEVGQSTQATAVLLDRRGRTLDWRVSWSSSDTLVATVAASGVVTAISPGSAAITATRGRVSGSALLTVVPSTVTGAGVPVASVTVSPSSSSILIGRTVQLAAVTRDASGNVLTGRAISWSSANSGVVTGSGTGLVTAMGRGATRVTATSESASGTASITASASPPPP